MNFSKVIQFEGEEYKIEECFSSDFSSLSSVTQVSGVLLSPADTSILLVAKNAGEWGLPGGKPEFGESFIDTLIREVYEEGTVTLVPSTITPLFYLLSEKKVGGSWIFHGIQLRYFAEIDSIEDWKSDPANEVKYRTFVKVSELEKWLPWGNTSRKIQEEVEQYILLSKSTLL